MSQNSLVIIRCPEGGGHSGREMCCSLSKAGSERNVRGTGKVLRCLELLIGVDLIRSLLRDHIKVVLLEESKVLTGLAELSLFHTLTDIPVHEGTLSIHDVVLLGDALGEHTGHGHVVSDHGHIARRRGKDVLGQGSGRLVVEADLETSGAPLDERDLVVLLEPLDG